MEYILIFLQIVKYRRKRCMQFYGIYVILFHIADLHIVLLSLNIQEVVDGKLQIVTSYLCIVNSHNNVCLNIRCLVKQSL